MVIFQLFESGFFNEFLFVKVRSISDQSIVNFGSSNITRLPILMPMAYQELVFLIGEGDWTERMKEIIM